MKNENKVCVEEEHVVPIHPHAPLTFGCHHPPVPSPRPSGTSSQVAHLRSIHSSESSRHIASLLLLMLSLLITSCSTHKHMEYKEESMTQRQDTTLSFASLISHLGIHGSITFTPIYPDTNVYKPYKCIQTYTSVCEERAAETSKESVLPSVPYRIDIDLSIDKEEESRTEHIDNSLTQSTISSEVVQDTSRGTNAASWWLSFRFRAILCLFLLTLPFAVVGFYRIYSHFRK